MKRHSVLKKTVSCVASAAMAVMMVPAVGGGVALAAPDSDNWWSSYQPASAANVSSNALTSYGVRAGSAGPDYLGITNTNFDFTAAGANADKQFNYTGYAANYAELSGLAIWGSSANTSPNPYYQNLLFNIINHKASYDTESGAISIASDGASSTATSWSSNGSNSWGDSNGYTNAGTNTKAGMEYGGPDIVFGASKTSGWSKYSASDQSGSNHPAYGTNFRTYDAASSTFNPDYANNDATNIWTQIYSMGKLAQKADSSSKAVRYNQDSAVTSAVDYEKATRGQMLYVASKIDAGTQQKKTVAYLYSIDGSDGAKFFTPQASGLTSGNDSGKHSESSSDSTTNPVANSNYAANNATIDLGYMATLPFITTTFTSSSTTTISMKVEDIVKANPACSISSEDKKSYRADGSVDYAGILDGVDVLIYNSNMNTLGVSTEADLQAWAAQYGFSGTYVAGDDYGTSKNQTRVSGGTTNGQSPKLYCQRNYTADKNARAAWAYAQVYPELYSYNPDATYGYWVNRVYHINADQVPAVAKYMANKSAFLYSSYYANLVDANAEQGYAWWTQTGINDSDWNCYDYYNGSSRASFYSDDAEKTPVDTVGIFAPSQVWTDYAAAQSSALTTMSLRPMAVDTETPLCTVVSEGVKCTIYNSKYANDYDINKRGEYSAGYVKLVVEPAENEGYVTGENTGGVDWQALAKTEGVTLDYLAAAEIEICDGVTKIGPLLRSDSTYDFAPRYNFEVSVASSVEEMSIQNMFGGYENSTGKTLEMKFNIAGLDIANQVNRQSKLAKINGQILNFTSSSKFANNDTVYLPVEAKNSLTQRTVPMNAPAFGNTATVVGLEKAKATDISSFTLTAADATYDGAAYGGKVTLTDAEGNTVPATTGEGEEAVSSYTLSYAKADGTAVDGVPTEAGSYTVTATGNESAAYTGTTASASFTIAKAAYDMSGVTFEDKTVTYDGKAQSIEVAGNVPAGVTVSYKGNGQVNAGTYDVTANFAVADEANYEAIEPMTAKLTISKAAYDMSGVTFEDKTVTYDGKAQSLAVSGLPEGVSVTYKNNGQVNAGTYAVTANFAVADEANCEAIAPMTAKLTISKAAQSINKAKVKASKTSVKASKLKKKGKTVATVARKATAKTAVKYTFKVTKNASYVKVTKTGKIVTKKALKKGKTIKVRVTMTAAASSNYNAAKKVTKTITIKVK